MKELTFRLKLDAWKDITIKIKDEKLFKEKYKNFSDEEYEGEHLNYLDLEENCFDDCIEEIEHGDIDWDNEDYEEFIEVIDNYFGLPNNCKLTQINI
jgi:hypothetical protein